MFTAKTIYLDGRSLADPQPKGVARYTVEMLKCLSDFDLNVIVISNRPYHQIPVVSSNITYKYLKYCRFFPGFLFVIFLLPFILFKRKMAVFWGINHAVPAFGIRSILTIHDLVAFRSASTMTLYNAIATKFSIVASLQFADLISTVSIKTKNELISSKLIAKDRQVYVVSNIIDVDLFKPASARTSRDKVILILGSIEPRKNILNALSAFNALCNFDNEWRLFIVGGKNWGANEIFNEIDNSLYKENIKLVDHINDFRLAELYRSVAVLLFPSYDEGFGLPVFEAISCGCPVLSTVHCELKYYLNKKDILLLFDPLQDNLATRLIHSINNLDDYVYQIDIPTKRLANSQINILLHALDDDLI